MSSEEQRIREFAYQIWQSEGCPEGQEERHWAMARKLAEAEHGAAVATDKPASRARKTATKPTDVTPKKAKDAKDVKDVKEAPAAKPRATRAAPKADTDAKAGTPEGIKKTRTPRAKKES